MRQYVMIEDGQCYDEHGALITTAPETPPSEDVRALLDYFEGVGGTDDGDS